MRLTLFCDIIFKNHLAFMFPPPTWRSRKTSCGFVTSGYYNLVTLNSVDENFMSKLKYRSYPWTKTKQNTLISLTVILFESYWRQAFEQVNFDHFFTKTHNFSKKFFLTLKFWGVHWNRSMFDHAKFEVNSMNKARYVKILILWTLFWTTR